MHVHANMYRTPRNTHMGFCFESRFKEMHVEFNRFISVGA